MVAVFVVLLTAIAITRGVSTGQAPQSNGSVPAELTARVEPGVVDVDSTLGLQSAEAAGTGMVLSSSGEVLTNNHVVNGATNVKVTVVGNGRSYSAVVVGTDASHDVAVLRLEGASGLATVPIGNSASVSVGDAVVALGNAGGVGGKPSTASGSVTALNQSITATDPDGLSEQLSGMIQTDAPIQPGDSGGPLINRGGNVVGMNTAASNGYTMQAGAEAGFSVPINTALAVAAQIEAGKTSPTIHIGPAVFLGIAVQDTPNGSGAEIVGVFDGSPAENAGLSEGDVVTSIDGQPVNSASDLTNDLRAFHPGDSVTLGWIDQSGQQHAGHIQLVTGPAD